jgi:predicted ATPase
MKRTSKPNQKSLPGMNNTLGAKRLPLRYFEAVKLERDKVTQFNEYPFSIPSIRHLDRLEFHPAVTFFIGENGSGKSTLLEAIAVKAGFSVEGATSNCDLAHAILIQRFTTASVWNAALDVQPMVFFCARKVSIMWPVNWRKLKKKSQSRTSSLSRIWRQVLASTISW